MNKLDKIYLFLILAVVAFIIYEVAGIGQKINDCAGFLNFLSGNCDPQTAENNKLAQQGYTTGTNTPCKLGDFLRGNCTDTSGLDCGWISFGVGGCTTNN